MKKTAIVFGFIVVFLAGFYYLKNTSFIRPVSAYLCYPFECPPVSKCGSNETCSGSCCVEKATDPRPTNPPPSPASNVEIKEPQLQL
jgi:hypothetical protein